MLKIVLFLIQVGFTSEFGFSNYVSGSSNFDTLFFLTVLDFVGFFLGN